jgi:hypothetical protein
MQYMLMIYADESAFATMTPQDGEQMSAAYAVYSQELAASGALVAGERLKPSPNATIVRVRGGETLTTDGPFAETKEQLAGYYVIEAETLDDALAWAAKLPGAADGAVEVRPIWAMASMEATV